jgi:hypothetical protein
VSVRADARALNLSDSSGDQRSPGTSAFHDPTQGADAPGAHQRYEMVAA